MLFFRAQSTKAYTILVQVIASPTLSFLDFSIKSYNVCAVKPSYDNNMIKLQMKSRIMTQDKAGCNFRTLYDACSVASIPRGVLGTRLNLDTCQILVDGQIRFEYRYVFHVEIFESRKKKLRIKKYSDTCGLGLSRKKNNNDNRKNFSLSQDLMQSVNMSSLAGECVRQPFSIPERFPKAYNNGSLGIFSKKMFFFLQLTSVNSNLEKLTVSRRNLKHEPIESTH